MWLGTVMLVQSFSGGFLAFIMMTYSFIADNSTQRWVKLLDCWCDLPLSRERMVRIGLASFSWQVARPISYPLGALLYDSGGYTRVFASSLALYIVACLLGLYALWGFREKRVGGDTSFTGRY